MSSIINAAAVFVIISSILYYEGWLFLWLLRRQYGAHFSEIESPREIMFVIGAWALNWYPFYFLFICSMAAIILVDRYASGIGGSGLFIVIVAIFFFLFHRLTFVRALTVFHGSAREGFIFFPEVIDIFFENEDGNEELYQLKNELSGKGFRVLSRDSKKAILFRPQDEDEHSSMEICEVPASRIMTLWVRGASQFRNIRGEPIWKQLLPSFLFNIWSKAR